MGIPINKNSVFMFCIAIELVRFVKFRRMCGKGSQTNCGLNPLQALVPQTCWNHPILKCFGALSFQSLFPFVKLWIHRLHGFHKDWWINTIVRSAIWSTASIGPGEHNHKQHYPFHPLSMRPMCSISYQYVQEGISSQIIYTGILFPLYILR